MGVTFHNVHHALPYKLIRKLDTFLQKIGRAGREGHLSDEQIMHKKKVTSTGWKASLFDCIKTIVNVDMNSFVKHIFYLTNDNTIS